ncbi:uncharacterized protein LOC132555884 [Ylistrum balloti]|uniref:uncharacterized protein LOC132555884 n=1 Tax=Ylistrum balloti TaxID=509963 RepID=UPI002905C914|nr:uncharacterized protein LOC132555884 [Ylistrum balloti]
MEKIFIPDIEKIARSMSRTIDRFTDLVEAISLTEEGRSCVQNVSKVAVCRAVMMELTTKKIDFDGLYDILQNVILTLVADGCSGCCRTNQTRLPGLTSVQKEALRKTETFDKLLVKELKNQVRNLRQLVKKHRKLMAQDEKYRRESAKHEQKLGALLQQIHGSVPLKPRMLIFLQMKRDRVQKEMNRAKSARLTNSELEQSIRSQIKNISADLMCVITDKIKDKVEYGLEDCLLDVISKMSEREK